MIRLWTSGQILTAFGIRLVKRSVHWKERLDNSLLHRRKCMVFSALGRMWTIFGTSERRAGLIFTELGRIECPSNIDRAQRHRV